MNQFKKAKQKALESGHQVENIKDLQTAGVKEAVESPQTQVVEPVIVETPVVQEVVPESHAESISEPLPVVKKEETIIPTVIPVSEPEPIVEEEKTVTSTQQVQSPIPVPVRVVSVPTPPEVTYVAPVESVTPITPIVSTVPAAVPTSKASSAKKNIPNIFAPKNEAKSMRKSLVLKPTSVKIAENYCAKNGGSFNELIQTLLDNFIDEYGL